MYTLYVSVIALIIYVVVIQHTVAEMVALNCSIIHIYVQSFILL